MSKFWQTQILSSSVLGSVTQSFLSFLFTCSSFLLHLRDDTSPVFGDTLCSAVHSSHTLYRFPAVALVLGSLSSSLPSAPEHPLQLRIPSQYRPQLGISNHRLCWWIQGVLHLLLLSPFIFQSWGVSFPCRIVCCHTLLSPSSWDNGSPWWQWISDTSLVQGHNFCHFAKW